MGKIDWYDKFVDLDYTPSGNDLVAYFYFQPPKGMSKKESAGRIASESSTGTWTTLSKIPPRMEKLEATAFDISGNLLKVAYPIELWEPGNFCQLKSGIAGNVFGMKGVENLRLIDVSFPEKYLRNFKGPILGMKGIRKRYGIEKRPLTGAVPKPKIGFSAAEHAKVGYETWMGGFDFVKDDENLSSLRFNKFDTRVRMLARMRDKAEARTGERKDAFVNITAETNEMLRRGKVLYDHGFRYIMVDAVVVGTAALATLRERLGDLKMTVHAHRAMHAAFTRNEKHGISMQFLAKEMRILGMNQLHSGTAVGKLVGTRKEVLAVAGILRDKAVKETKGLTLEQDWGRLKPAFPVSSGGLHPGLVPAVMDIYGSEFVLLVSGGIHGHPDGTRAGAKATMQAIEAVQDGLTLEEKAKRCKELARALEKWGRFRPK